MNDKLNFIENFLKKHEYVFYPEDFQEENNINIVFDILHGKTPPQNDDNGLFDYYTAVYFEEKDISETKKYLLKSIEKGFSHAMVTYGWFMKKERNIEEAKKYYLMAIETGNKPAIYNYILLMEEVGNIEEAKKYCLIGIEKGCVKSMTEYALLIEKENSSGSDLGGHMSDLKSSEAKKYNLMAIEKGDKFAMNNYANILFRESKLEKSDSESHQKISEAKKYYLMAIEKECVIAMNNYAILMKDIDKREAIKYYYKYYEKSKDSSVLTNIKELLYTDEMSLIVGQMILRLDEVEERVENLSNFKEAVNDIGPMNALVLGYI